MEPLSILLIVLIAAGVWAVVELALTLRKARVTLDEVSHSATEAVDQAVPAIEKIDGILDELQPVMRDLPPLVDKADRALDDASVSLAKVDHILHDVSSATRGVAGVGESASRIMGTATSAAVGVVSKVASLGGITIPEGQNLIGKGNPEPEPAREEPVHEESAHKGGYVTYAPVTTVDETTKE